MNVLTRVATLASFIVVSLVASKVYAVNLTIQDACSRTTTGTATKADPNASVLTAGASGALTITDYSGSYAAIGDCQALASAPVCALSASNTRTAKGSTVTLFAKCTAPTDSITWNTPTGSPSLTSTASIFAKTVTFPNAGAYTYTVKGVSTANGTGVTSAPITVLVGNDVASGTADKPTCLLTLSPASVEPGQSATASVVCQPEATTYAWDAAETNAPASPSPSTALTNLTFSTVGTYTYKVAGVAIQGTGPKASATITVANGVTLRGTASMWSTGALVFPTGTQSTDSLLLYTITTNDFATPTGWANVAKRALTNYPNTYVNLFTRVAGSATSVTIRSFGAVLAYDGGTGFGTAAAFVESTPSSNSCAVTLTRTTAGGVVVTFITDADSIQPSLPSGFTSRLATSSGTSNVVVADRYYGSTGSASASWSQTAGHAAHCTSVEIKR